MSSRETLERLRRLAAEIPYVDSAYPLSEPSFAPPATLEEIDALEGAVRAQLPRDYRELLTLCSGISAMDVWNGYAIHGVELVRRIFEAGDVPMELAGETLLPIASDGGGNLFLISLPSGAVLKWRHDIPSLPFQEMAPSFAAFLDRMAADWSHFIEDDRLWNYMSG